MKQNSHVFKNSDSQPTNQRHFHFNCADVYFARLSIGNLTDRTLFAIKQSHVIMPKAKRFVVCFMVVCGRVFFLSTLFLSTFAGD